MGQATEYARYLGIRDRRLSLPPARLMERIANRSVLVTGATGCVGTALLRQLSPLRPARLVGIGVDEPAEPLPGVEYHHVDIRDTTALRALFRRSRPDVVVHLAAQRDPGLAESLVAQTVTTNVIGTANVIEQSLAFDVEDLVYASTGKAMRFYTRDVYAASKKIAEWLVVSAGTGHRPAVTVARFTHVVDNAIVLQKFRDWCRSGQALRLHDPSALFYAQSAGEAAELLLGCLLAARSGQPALCAIQDLEWPFRLRDIAEGVLGEFGNPPAIHIVGEQPGYEQGACPGLYDPALSGDISPLLNAVEGRSLLDAGVPGVDVVAVATEKGSAMDEQIAQLHEARLDASTPEPAVRELLDRTARRLLDVTMAIASDEVVARVDKLMRQADPGTFSPAHRVAQQSIRERLGTR
ncbi:polysaccharide biosynthesis protein [Actinoplanes siamensis]|uniref:Polysaccharide biosynthesis protein CapD-like domain-containing protein n=1 Tax=Actinoplanes siamensis TaxID=1223317 RepID=A0A919NCQ0_9ACTN|nr:polysaccharide biosynthesis protein [Actinoplanes siamensis]GIF08235.1 hypothetical protein Asi03nite_57730 [Actinoplanes siamensis]